MKHSFLPSLLVVCCLIFATGCSDTPSADRLRPGDLLFQDLNCGALCDAIEAVTEGVNGNDFSHCGMVVEVHDTLKVIEAIGSQVQINSLERFFARSGDTAAINNIIIARVKDEFGSIVEDASKFAIQKTGEPYDTEFLLHNGKWYCSELLYEAFKFANEGQDFFELAPMTFKDPSTHTFFPAWVDYYQDLNVEIPEGKPGLNPGSISRSEKIELVNINDRSWLQQ